MKRYIDTDNQRYRYYIRESLNGYVLQLLIVDRDETVALTPQVAALLQISLPEGYRVQCCTEVAALNGWTAIERD